MKPKKRTLYSKFGLAVAMVASKDVRDVALNRVHLASDGSTVASNGRALLAVSPPLPAKARTFPQVEADMAETPANGVGMSLADVARVRRNFPTEKRPSLQFAQLTRCDDTKVELMTTDGKTHLKVAGALARGKFPRWRKVLAAAKKQANKARFCVDRQSLILALQAIDKACPDRGGYNPVFVEIGEPLDAVVLRSQNFETGQVALGIVRPLQVVDWLKPGDWERGLGKASGAVKVGD